MIEGYSIMIITKKKPIDKKFISYLVSVINEQVCSVNHSGDCYNEGHIWISEHGDVDFSKNNIVNRIKNLPEVEDAKLCRID